MKKVLQDAGLNGNEATVYLAILELGSTNIAMLTKETKLPRSTVYSVLATLEPTGLVFTYLRKKTRMYTAHDPSIILKKAKERVALIEEALPELNDLYRSSQSHPQIRYFQGRSEIREMYDGILKMRGLKMYDIICSEEAWLEMGQSFAERFKSKRAEKKIMTRLILGHSPPALARKRAEEETYSEVKIIPPGLHWSATAGCYIFEDRVIFLGYKKEHIAVEIQSKEIAQLMQMNFEFMWRFLAR